MRRRNHTTCSGVIDRVLVTISDLLKCGDQNPNDEHFKCEKNKFHTGPHRNISEVWANEGQPQCGARFPERNGPCLLLPGHSQPHDDDVNMWTDEMASYVLEDIMRDVHRS